MFLVLFGFSVVFGWVVSFLSLCFGRFAHPPSTRTGPFPPVAAVPGRAVPFPGTLRVSVLPVGLPPSSSSLSFGRLWLACRACVGCSGRGFLPLRGWPPTGPSPHHSSAAESSDVCNTRSGVALLSGVVFGSFREFTAGWTSPLVVCSAHRGHGRSGCPSLGTVRCSPPSVFLLVSPSVGWSSRLTVLVQRIDSRHRLWLAPAPRSHGPKMGKS